MQAPKDWHLVVIVLLIISIAAALVVGKSVSQLDLPVPVRDNEDSGGRTVGFIDDICPFVLEL